MQQEDRVNKKSVPSFLHSNKLFWLRKKLECLQTVVMLQKKENTIFFKKKKKEKLLGLLHSTKRGIFFLCLLFKKTQIFIL